MASTSEIITKQAPRVLEQGHNICRKVTHLEKQPLACYWALVIEEYRTYGCQVIMHLELSCEIHQVMKS